MYYSSSYQAVFETKVHSFWQEEAAGTNRDTLSRRWTDPTFFSESYVQATRMGAIELFADKAKSDAGHSIEYNLWHIFARYLLVLFLNILNLS